ncbi:MAG TPA: cell division/cell wall cluster transcriptional repressor MraZ, partial [Candidatus Limnocylindria bacterium]
QEFVHFVLGGAHETEPDAQGRIVVPAHLRQYAALGSEAVVIGAAQHLEVWEPTRWQQRLASIQPSIADDLAGLGI